MSEDSLVQLGRTKHALKEHPYSVSLHVTLAQQYYDLHYPDLAAAAAYKALMLADAVQDESDEYHDAVLRSFHQLDLGPPSNVSGEDDQFPKDDSTPILIESRINERYLPSIYRLLARGLLSCGCYRTAFQYCSQGLAKFSDDSDLQSTSDDIYEAVADRLGSTFDALSSGKHNSIADWPDAGFVRREVYPWNAFEPDRLSDLTTLNQMMSQVAPKLEVRVMELPNLSSKCEIDSDATVKQLGVFAKEDLHQGEIILNETSFLTANNKLQDALCDACSEELPALASTASGQTVACPECQVVFCSQRCYDEAADRYHPALCDMDVESIAKDVTPTEASDALYSLLLLRSLAMAETQHCHPLDLKEVKYIWGDFQTSNSESEEASKTLPFSFEHNIRLPFHMLEKMDIDIFANQQYDVWVFNTLYAKFRGTASARLSGLGGRRARGPEVSAVHPMWCLANHSCDPNVSWSWGGSIKFEVQKQRIAWQRPDRGEIQMNSPGIKKGEEVLNHYCDITLPVKERREWASGALGGDCPCPRCSWEAGEAC